MALLFTESFDWIGAALTDLPQKWTGPGSTGTAFPPDADVSTSYGRTGKGCRIAPTKGLSKGFTLSTTVIVGLAIKPVLRAATSTAMILFVDDLGSIVRVRLDADGGFSLYTTVSGATVSVGGAGALPANVWKYLEIKLVHGDTGSITMKVDGVQVAQIASVDTKATTSAGFQSVEFYCGSSGSEYDIDEVVVMDTTGSTCNDFLGDVRVVGLLPQTDAVGGAGSNADFTPSTGTDHGALVDEVGPNGDTDYLSSSTLNHVDTWHFPALGYTGVIKAVAMNINAKKIDAGTRAIQAVTRPASTNRAHGTDKYLSTSYANQQAIWEVNPEDSAAWEVADVDGAQFGVKVTV